MMRSLDGPGSYAGSGIDVVIEEIMHTCPNEDEGCDFSGLVEAYNDKVECPDCGLEVSFQ